MSVPDLDQVRAQFPALGGDTVFLENAGGSQVPRGVADAMHRYLLESYVQLGAGYQRSQRATATVDAAHRFLARFLNAEDRGKVAIGPSTSILCHLLAEGYAARWRSGDEVIVAETAHESNYGPWARLERVGAVVHHWPIDPRTARGSMETLETLLSERTRIVALPHVSNLLGEIVDLAPIVAAAHRVGARVVVDGVAFAPHRAVDVAAWEVDWYVFSTYKVYGPHAAALYGREDAWQEIEGLNHFFVAAEDQPTKFELGGVNHEACAGILALAPYLAFLVGESCDPARPLQRSVIERAFARMTELELPLQERFLSFLRSKPAVRIVGPEHGQRSRVGTISFVHAARRSQDIAAIAHRAGVGIRHGHMYAHRLCTALGLDPVDGVVRVSLLHYNSAAEIDRLITALDPVL